MSTAVEITVTGPGRPEEAALQTLLALVNLEPDQILVSEDRAGVSFWDRKWGVQGADLIAERISAQHPNTTVTLEETWDGRDEDEPGGTGAVWRAGAVILRGEIRWVWEDAK